MLLSNLSSSFNYFHGGDEWSKTCKTGKKQSPISFIDSKLTVISVEDPKLQVYIDLNDEFEDYFRANYEKGTIECSRSFGKVTLSNVDYFIGGMHFHSPSEHQVDGQAYDLEVHLVGQSQDSKLHVIGIFFEKDGPANQFIDAVQKKIDFGQRNYFESSWLILDGQLDDYYYYEGSVTAPIINDDCVEDVRWTILKNPLTISENQFDFFHKRWAGNESFAQSRGNNRKIQELNGRKIFFHSAVESWSALIRVGMALALMI
jgi:carbonic anhydrase